MIQIRKYLKSMFVASTLILASATGMANASTTEQTLVQSFYNFLSNPASKEHASAFKAVTANDWKSIGDYSGQFKTRDQFIGQVSGFFAELMPDLNWEVQEMIQEGGKVVVRSRATGTPKGPLFGVDGEGRGFDILAIDIHTIENGKIVNTYHVEDWAAALQQLRGK